jgi:hypothetical protein
MLDQTIRQAILSLRDAGNGIRAIARALGISRLAVKRVLAGGNASPPLIERAEKAEPHRDDILALLAECKGNLVRVRAPAKHHVDFPARHCLAITARCARTRRRAPARVALTLRGRSPTVEIHHEASMKDGHDRRRGPQGDPSSGGGSSASAPGKRTLTEQLDTGAAPDVDQHAAPAVQPHGSQSQPMTAAAAQQLLQNAYGSYRQISAGQVRVLAQADFQVAYDAIYGSGPYAWATYVVPRFGNLNGFANNGVNYINRDAANVTTVPHEMLHTNVAADWRPVVGSPFDEGATEYLEQHALRTGDIPTSLTHYPNQRAVVEAYLTAGASQDALFRAYLVGGAQSLVASWVDTHCQGTWAQVKTATESSQWAVARASLMPRAAAPGGAGPGGAAPGGATPAAPAAGHP